MKLKLDENIGNRCQQMLKDAGNDVATILEQNLAGAADPQVIGVCQQEQRCLVSDKALSIVSLFEGGK